MAGERSDVTVTTTTQTAVAPRPVDTLPARDASADELQRLLRHKREQITQTVEEIKMNLQGGAHDTKDKMKETLDWRLQMERYPLAAIAGAVAIGFLAGSALGGVVGSERSEHRRDRTRNRSRIITGSSIGAGTSLAPSSSSSFDDDDFKSHKPERHLIPPALKSKVGGRLEEVLSELADNLFNEISRVGREVIVPTVVSNLTNAFTHEGSSGTGRSSSGSTQSRSTYSPKSATEGVGISGAGIHEGSTAAGGPISSSADDEGRSRFPGRGI